MGLYTKLPEEITEVDVIIVGGGTAGCIVASRLADADPGLSILVIEGGPNNDSPVITHPMFFFSHMLPTSKTNIVYPTKQSEHLGGRAPFVHSGGTLGGGSSTNLMMYSRGLRRDFDTWGMPGWGADDMLPYMKKLETYHGPDPNDKHGDSGPIQVSRGTFQTTRAEKDFLSALGKLGWPEYPDMQALDVSNGTQKAMKFIAPDGKRQDTASCYLHPRLEDDKHPNLHVLIEHQVVRVLFKGSKASGVEYLPNPIFQEGGASPQTIKARKLVVVSCGALGSPLVLERSGVGSSEVLRRVGVPTVTDLPGVGEGYQDHNLVAYAYRSNLGPHETFDRLTAGHVTPEQLIETNDPMLGWNAQDATSKLRPNEAQVAALGPEFQEAWDRDFKNEPLKPLALITLLGGFPGDPTLLPGPPAQYFGTSTFTSYPYSRGHIHIMSPDTIHSSIDFDPGFFSNPLDVKMLVWAYKTQREIARRMHVYRGEVVVAHPPFAAGSRAACVELDAPLGDDVKDLEYSDEDDRVLETWLRANVNTTWHSLGTCRMAPRDENGVVDAALNVYGVEGLKVVDMSIVPGNVAANTCNTAMVVGEMAADIIIRELGLSSF